MFDRGQSGCRRPAKLLDPQAKRSQVSEAPCFSVRLQKSSFVDSKSRSRHTGEAPFPAMRSAEYCQSMDVDEHHDPHEKIVLPLLS